MILHSDFGMAHYAPFVKKEKEKKISRDSKFRKYNKHYGLKGTLLPGI